MKLFLRALVVMCCGGAFTACNAARPAGELHPTATIKELMDSILGPSADAVWASVATIVTLEGTEERAPKTDEEWAAVRRDVVRLVEATNLLLIDGRRVAKPGEKSEYEGIELEPEEIQALIDGDRDTFRRLALGLRDAVLPAYNAVEAKDARALSDSGEGIEHACETCHMKYCGTPMAVLRQDRCSLRVRSGDCDGHVFMKRLGLPLAGCALAALLLWGRQLPAAAAQASGGTITGRVQLSGKPPGNPVIRMGMDPMCSRTNAGKRVINEAVSVTADGGLANVFVHVQGAFPRSSVPVQPVTIDQRGCIYSPRVVGARVDQILQVRNSDAFLHNVHSLSGRGNVFNVGQPLAGMIHTFQLKNEEVMLRLKCDMHSWMTAYVGVVAHPYYAVSGVGGAFTIEKVPAGTHSVQIWHERYGTLTRSVRVKAGAATKADFTFTGNEKPPAAALRDLSISAGAVAQSEQGSPTRPVSDTPGAKEVCRDGYLPCQS